MPQKINILHLIKSLGRGGAEKLDGVVGGDGAGRFLQTALLHEVPGGRPVAVAIEKGADDAAVEHAGESLVVCFGLPGGHDFRTANKAPDAQPLGIGRAATKAAAGGRILLLQAWVVHGEE